MQRPSDLALVPAYTTRAFRRSQPLRFRQACTRGNGIEFLTGPEVAAELAASGPEPDPGTGLSGPEVVQQWVDRAFDIMEKADSQAPPNREGRRAAVHGWASRSEGLDEPSRDDDGPPGHLVATSPAAPHGPPASTAAPLSVGELAAE